jgi:serine protease AprX
VAPAAHVVAVKVAGATASSTSRPSLEAMHWISAYREQFGIRVLNLSWGVASTQSPSVDPINHAVQRLWSEGIVVVVAAGNSGSSAGTITKPGDDPVVLTVGAYDDKGDLEPNNDSVPQWSSRGPDGRRAWPSPTSSPPAGPSCRLRSPGSTIERNNPKALLAPSYIRGSGTSQAAAVTSGAAALLLANRPSLTPDQVKALLTTTTSPIPNTGRNTQGTGRLQLEAAVAAPRRPPCRPCRRAASARSTPAAGSQRVVATCGGAQVEIRGEIDVRCQPWDGSRWSGSRWSTDAWTGVAWKGAEWTGVAWKGVAWSDANWDGVAWKGGTWTSGSWYGAGGWTGDTTASSPWTGVAWKDSSWTGVAWKESGWTTGEWTGAEYDEFLTAFWGATPPAGKRVKGEAFTAKEDNKP